MSKNVSLILLVTLVVAATTAQPGKGVGPMAAWVTVSATLVYDIPISNNPRVDEFPRVVDVAEVDQNNGGGGGGGAVTCWNVDQICNLVTPCCAGLWCDNNSIVILGVCKKSNDVN
ncbi:hypothetical protein SOVF_094250 [Spinacia oleracea]|nr:hypothetical protein SOVF_094250 [Spinacia oleracea]